MSIPTTGDLFGDEPGSLDCEHRRPPDAELAFYPRFFGRQECRAYMDALSAPGAIDWRQDEIAMYGRMVPIPRLNAWYGDDAKNYTYSGLRMDPKPWTPELAEIKARIEPLAGVEFTSVLVNLYRDGSDSVAWHSDDEPELGRNPVIASVSFGAAREFQLRHKRYRTNRLPRENFVLGPGSLLIMGGATQHHWQHQVPKRAVSRVPGPRVNLTFRRL